MRKKIAAGNWKMNLDKESSIELAKQISEHPIPEGVHVILGTPYVYLSKALDICSTNPSVDVASQNCHQKESGAYTGEISIPMLDSLGLKYCIVGHSERRELFGESDQVIKEKIDALLNKNITPIFCCGEPLNIREDGSQNEYVSTQLDNSIFHLSSDQLEGIVIAYEPIWAIGTGKTASPEQAQDMHAFIRSLIEDKYGAETADKISILYGGSVKPANAKDLFSQQDVDGGLVGGASLKSESFIPIIEAFG